MTRVMLRAHPLPLGIVLAALAATAGVFLFARPAYHDPYPGVNVDFSYVHPPLHARGERGWAWRDGTPGFRFGKDDVAWNGDAHLRPDELAGARAAAARAGVDADDLRVLNVQRATDGGGLLALVAGADRLGRTCVGAVVPRTRVDFYCPGPRAALPLGGRAVLVIVAPLPSVQTRKYGRLYPLFLSGATRGDVTRVTLVLPGLQHATLYRRSWTLANWWGTFGTALELPRPWRGRLDVYGAHGRLATLRLGSSAPGERLVPLGG